MIQTGALFAPVSDFDVAGRSAKTAVCMVIRTVTTHSSFRKESPSECNIKIMLVSYSDGNMVSIYMEYEE